MQSYKADELPENPRETANPISSLMFCFTMPTFFKGRKKVLQESDLYRALKEHKSDFVGHKLKEAWEKECSHKKYRDKKPNLLKATLRVFGNHFFLMGFITLITEIVKISQPLFLGKLVASFAIANTISDRAENDTAMDIDDSYLYAAGVILTCIFSVVAAHPNVLGIAHTGMKIRVALCSLIYRKALRLSKAALIHSSTGQMVNLISNDVGRLDTSILHTHYLWVGPLEVIIVTYLMFLEVGVSAILGVALLLLFVPLQMFLGKKISTLRLRTAVKTDERVRLMNEIVNGIQVIKMYAWELPFAKMVQFCRRKEMNAILYANYIRGVMNSFLMFVSRLTIFASLVGYVLFGQFLTAEKAFIITAYCNLLRLSMTVFFPLGITQMAETLVSFKRIQQFLLLDEIHLPKKSLMGNIKNGNNIIAAPITEEIEKYTMFSGKKFQRGPSSICIKNLVAKWITKSSENTLDKININVTSKTLVAVIGPVGSGKSSLIQALLGELPAYSGSIEINGTVSYAAQDPWLFTGTVRQNILFGLPLDKRRYQLTIKKCALERDFNLLPFGDKTIVGERGASLSGGQKARINLARAVYRQADIYLLDDPLSAVDTQVARHLFDQCIRDYLRDEIVILVTHQLQFVERADLIIIMDKGKVSAAGTYSTISQSGLNFAQLLQHSNDDQNEDDDTSKIMPEGRRSLKLRKSSICSFNSKTDATENEIPMQSQEEREEGKIGFKLYHQYFKASGGYGLVVIWIVMCLLTQIFVSGADYYLSLWATKYERGENDPTDIYIFTGLNIGVILLTQIRTILFFILAMRSSINLHNNMFISLTRTAMYFFHTNPSGRILNRFSKDMGQVDEILPAVLIDVIQIFLQLVGIIVVLCMVNPWYVIITIIMGVAFYFLRNFYLKTSRDVKRLEATTRSPIYSHLAASLNGLSTIRAFGAEDILIAEFDNYQDLHSSTFYMFLTTNRAFGYWMDCSCVLYIILVTLSFFVFGAENGGDVGLAITQAMGMTGMVQWGMRQSAELENTMTSVERVIEYGTIPPEGEFHSANDKKPPKSWPQNGHIIFANLSLRYTPEPTNTERVLKSLNFEIKSAEKVGIVGRTGAGKSSLINALFRLSYNDGKIIIDDHVTEELGLHDLRRKISIIPQEPVLFSGTMRFNLDPFDEFNDDKLWDCLEEVKLKQLIADMPQGLQSPIREGGSNFSVGQRQLICLARAILRENSILVLDEATANVDPQTDALIQTTIRQKFKNCTVLTIAHRLNTIMDSDKVLVMDEGRAVEYDEPYKLLTDSPSQIFLGMVKQTGLNNYDNLLHIAQKAFEEKCNELNTKL